MTTLKLVSQDQTEVDLRRSLTDDDVAALQKRNEERAAAAKARLGRNWLCHPANKVPKKTRSAALDTFKRRIPGGI